MANPHQIATLVVVLALACTVGNGQLSSKFYSKTCPKLKGIVRYIMTKVVAKDPRTAGFIIRIFFHDCFVKGCDASILLDGREKDARPNQSLRRFEVIDYIKDRVEAECKETVSCADILALSALEGVAAVGGPRWSLGLGRRDATSASKDDVDGQIPPPSFDLSKLISSFSAKGLSARDMTALSGAHTIGLARCISFRGRIYGDSNIDPVFAADRRAMCPRSGGDNRTAPLDSTSTKFDNRYFKDLVSKRGLLHSDQQLFSGGSQDSLVRKYATNQAAFFADFKAAMKKMSDINPLTGSRGEIRRNCRVPN